MSFFAELQRRSVYRVAALYVVVSWLILQVVDVTLSLLPIPQWAGQLVFVLLAIGFPIALILAWAFELTPEGLKRDRDSGGERAAPPGKRSKLDFVILGLLVVALGYFAWQHDWSGDAGGVAPGEIRSIAVLPFENLMNDPDQAFFVAGMQEALITELSKIDALRVISRTTAMRYRGADKSVPEIAQELDVEAVVEGSVLKAGDVVRITVQLIAAESDQNLWAENFDRQLSDILVLYSEVTSEIASQIRITLTDAEKADIAATRQVDPEVYELYLRGRYLCENWSPEEMAQGTQLLQQAVSLDPNNAAAHAQLAVCLQYAAFFGYERPLEVFDRSRAAAVMAVDLDEDLADAHVALAGVMYYLDFDPKAALAALERALALDPTSIKALLHLSWLLGESGRFEEALKYNRRAIELDPLSTVVNHAMGQAYYLGRDYDSAIVHYEKALALDRSDPSLHFSIGWVREQQGRFGEAIEAHNKAVDLSSGATLYRASLGYSYALAGMQDEARGILDELMRDQGASPYEIAILQLGLGEHEQAIDWLEKAYEARDSHLIYIKQGPRFDPLRDNPRFDELLNRIDWLPASG